MKVDEDEETEPLPIIGQEDLVRYSKDEVTRKIMELEDALGKLKPNMNAIREFRKKDAEYQVHLSSCCKQWMLILFSG